MSEEPDMNVIWQPLPDFNGKESSQALAISCPCNVILYEGSRGPGKTDCQLMDFRSYVGKGYGKFWRGVIFDREYKNLDDMIAKSERWFPQFGDGARFLRSNSDYKWVWPTGEELLFRTYSKPGDYWNYHGQEFPWIGWNEVTKFATSKPIDMLTSTNRSGFVPEIHTPKKADGTYNTPDGKPLPNIPLRQFLTTNPYGPGHMWVKKRYVDPVAPGEIKSTTTNVFNPRIGERVDIVTTQVRLFGSYKENIYLDPIYVASLENITDPNRRKAWLEGGWDIVAGGALDDVWKDQTHVLPDFKIPKAWKVDRAMDWGSSAPFSVGWYAEADGNPVMLPDGREFCPVKGSLIRFKEWYGSESIGDNEGLRLGSDEVAQGVMSREMGMLNRRDCLKIPAPGPADSAIYSTDDKSQKTIAQVMEEEGIEWTKVGKGKGSRKAGLEIMRVMLRNAKTGEGPALYFTRCCQAAIGLLPMLPRDEEDPDDVDTLAEDHVYDEVRYKCQDATQKWPANLKVEFPK
jgi:hypothetical protein